MKMTDLNHLTELVFVHEQHDSVGDEKTEIVIFKYVNDLPFPLYLSTFWKSLLTFSLVIVLIIGLFFKVIILAYLKSIQVPIKRTFFHNY